MGWGLRQSAENEDRPLLSPIQQAQKGRSPGVAGLVWAAGVLWLGYLLEVNSLVSLFPPIYQDLLASSDFLGAFCSVTGEGEGLSVGSRSKKRRSKERTGPFSLAP